MPHQHERNPLSSTYRELGLSREPAAFGCDVGPERQRIGSPDGTHVTINLSHPRHNRSVVEPDGQSHVQPDLTAETLDDADEIRFAVAGCHEVDDADVTGIRCEAGLENQRIGAIPTRAG